MFNINSTLSRRNFLAGAAALGSTVALAGCSSGGSDGGSADDGKTFKIFHVEKTGKKTDKAPGTLLALTKQGLEIACGGGDVLVITELQAEGGKRMAASAYFNGHPIKL